MFERIPGVIVTYFPDAGFPTRVAALAAQVAPLLIADNTTDPAARERVAQIATANGVEFLPQPRNGGISGGLNAAFSALRSRGFLSAIAFDQDSTPASALAESLTSFASQSGCTIVGCDWYDQSNPEHHARHLQPVHSIPLFFHRRRVGPDGLSAVTFAITSGSLYSLDLWQRIGGFDETVPLDYADIDFCLRAQRYGARIGIAPNAHMEHNRGNKRPVHRFGRIWWPAHLPPSRLELLVAQQIRMVRRHGRRFPHWAIYEACHFLKLCFDATFLEPNPKESSRAIGRGLRRGATTTVARRGKDAEGGGGGELRLKV